jgi:hemoglobin
MNVKGGAMDDAKIEAVVHRFYGKVRQDALLGPIFNGAIADWDHHLALLCDFWNSVMLTSGRYKGNPMAAHAKHAPRLTPAAFARWLALWEETTAELLPPDEAAAMLSRARRIAASLQLGLHYMTAA